MEFRALVQLFGLRDLRNAAIGAVVVLGGLALAGLTFYLHRSEYAWIPATASLIFVLLILIFVVPPLARNASKEASQMNLPFEFTAGGAIVLGLVAIIGFSAWNTGNNLLFLILSFLVAAIVVGFFAGGYCLKKLDVKMRFPETIFAGEETPIFVSVSNRKRILPSFSVVAEVRGKEREESIAAPELRKLLPRMIADRLSRPPIIRRTLDYFVHVPRNHTIETKTEHVFAERGRFLIKDFELSTRFPFGFFRHRRRLPAKETELLVFPKFETVHHVLDELPLETGKLAANRRGSGQDLYALRDYQPNDDLRRVDWKATARSTQLTVREFSAEDDKRINIVLDTRLSPMLRSEHSLREVMDAEQNGRNILRPERFEDGVRLAAALLAYFTKEQAEIRLVIGGEKGDFGVGSRHLHDSLKRLAVVEPQFVESLNGDLGKTLGEIINEDEKAHNFVLTAASEAEFEGEILRNLQVIAY